MFGGLGYGNVSYGTLNDLWVYNGTYWTLLAGFTNGNYGQKGVPSPSNIPPARYDSVGWIDKKDSIWLFGGAIDDNNFLNDVWRWADGAWTWISGSNSVNSPGNYGVKQIPTIENMIPARTAATATVDSKGQVWISSGICFDGLHGNRNTG